MMPQNLNWIFLPFLLIRQGVDTKRYYTCEGGYVQLGCDWGFIRVVTANYGRTDRTTCSSGRSIHQLSNIQCFQETSVQTMSLRCDGRESCSVPAVNAVFSDPCVGTYKYLDVTYLCLPFRRSVICEGVESHIDCGNGLLWIHHANYGRRDQLTCPHKSATTPDCYSPQTDILRQGYDRGKTLIQNHFRDITNTLN